MNHPMDEADAKRIIDLALFRIENPQEARRLDILGHLVRAAREIRGLTREELAAQTGIPVDRLSEVEHHLITPYEVYEAIDLLSEALGYPLLELCDEPWKRWWRWRPPSRWERLWNSIRKLLPW